MKYAIISLGGALGMGLASIADAMKGSSHGEFYSGIGCVVMILGLIGTMGAEIIEWLKGDR